MNIRTSSPPGHAAFMSAWRLISLPTLAALLTLAGCSQSPPAESPAAVVPHKPTVFVVNYPLEYFARRLGGDAFAVEFPMQEAGDPAFWEPPVPALLAFQKADLVVFNGAGFGAWTEKVSLPERRTLDAGAAFRNELLSSGEVVTHSHGMQGAHTHPTVAFTTWLDPRLAMLQADAIATALGNLQPAEKPAIAARLIALKADWTAWTNEFEAIVAPHRQRPVIASHPVYQYLIRAGGGLNWRSVHWEPDAAPTAEQWEKFAALLEAQPVKFMVWESAPLPAVREKLAKDFGIACVVVDPTSNRPAEGDLLSAMRANLEELRKVYAH